MSRHKQLDHSGNKPSKGDVRAMFHLAAPSIAGRMMHILEDRLSSDDMDVQDSGIEIVNKFKKSFFPELPKVVEVAESGEASEDAIRILSEVFGRDLTRKLKRKGLIHVDKKVRSVEVSEDIQGDGSELDSEGEDVGVGVGMDVDSQCDSSDDDDGSED